MYCTGRSSYSPTRSYDSPIPSIFLPAQEEYVFGPVVVCTQAFVRHSAALYQASSSSVGASVTSECVHTQTPFTRLLPHSSSTSHTPADPVNHGRADSSIDHGWNAWPASLRELKTLYVRMPSEKVTPNVDVLKGDAASFLYTCKVLLVRPFSSFAVL